MILTILLAVSTVIQALIFIQMYRLVDFIKISISNDTEMVASITDNSLVNKTIEYMLSKNLKPEIGMDPDTKSAVIFNRINDGSLDRIIEVKNMAFAENTVKYKKRLSEITDVVDEYLEKKEN